MDTPIKSAYDDGGEGRMTIVGVTYDQCEAAYDESGETYDEIIHPTHPDF